jgi:antitoxin CcdA
VGYDRTAAKQAIDVTVNEDLVRQARKLTQNLSGTIEALLASFVEQETARRAVQDERVAAITSGLNQIRERHGSLADDFSPLD